MAHDVFISHSVKDKATADAVCAMLESNGIRCWIAPRDVLPSMEWGEAIIDAIEQCRIMVLVFTANANASPQIRREVERAVNRGVAILPIRVEDVLPAKALEYFIGNVHWLDALTPPLEVHLKNLAGTLKMLLARMEPRATPPTEPAEAAPAAAPRREIGPPPSGARETSSQGRTGVFVAGPGEDRLARDRDPRHANADQLFGELTGCEEEPLPEATRPPQASATRYNAAHGPSRTTIASNGQSKTPRPKKRKLAFVFVGAGIVLIFAPLILFVTTGSIPFLVPASIPANEAKAIQSMRAIHQAEARYQALYPGRGYACSLAKLGGHRLFGPPNADAAQLLPNDLASGSKDGYIFQTACMWDSGGVFVGYNLYAFPKAAGLTGNRGFCGDWLSDRITVDPKVDPARGPNCRQPLD